MTRTKTIRMMKAGTLNSEQATDAVNADTITADEMFDYFEYGTCPRS